MKKVLIVVGILVIALIVWLALKSGPTEEVAQEEIVTEQSKPEINPADISFGIYDPAEEPSALTKLLQARAQSLGFDTFVLKEIVDPEAVTSEKTTLLYKPELEDKLDVVIQKLIAKAVFRKGQNQGISRDVIIASWNIEDIAWGDLKDQADVLDNPNPASVSVLVFNAGAEPDSAGDVAELIIDSGFTETVAENAEEDIVTTKPIIIYYQRNYKNAAKLIRSSLAETYEGVTYRPQLEQEANIVVILGAVAEQGPIEE